MTPEEYLASIQSKTQRTQSDPESVLQWYQSYNDQLRAQQAQADIQRAEKERIAAERFAAQEAAAFKAQQEAAAKKARTENASDPYNPRVFFNSEGFKNASYKKKRELAEEWANTVGTQYADPAAIEDFRKNIDERLGISGPKSTITEDVVGIGSGLVSGLVGTAKAVTDIAGTDNVASEFLGKQRENLQGLYSAEQKERSKQLDEQGQQYEAEGNVLGQVMTGAERILTTGPGAAEMIGSTAAAVIPGAIVGKVAQGAALAKGATAAVAAARGTQAATRALTATGAIVGAGSVKGGIYDAVQNASDQELMGDPAYALMRKTGLTEKQAKEQFGKEQSEYFNSPLAILAGATAGALAARLGSVERAVAGGPSVGGVKGFGLGAAREVLTEAPQSATEVLAANLGASPAIPATRGLAESVGAAVAGGTALGGPAGLVQSRVDRLTQAKQTAPTEQPQEQQPEVPQAGEVENARRIVEEYQATQNPELADEYESALTILENAGVTVGEAQATEATVTPAVQDGMVRMYHGGFPGQASGKVWFTSSLQNAKGWASRNKGMTVEYVDIPESEVVKDLGMNFGEFKTIKEARLAGYVEPTNIELSEEFSSRRKQLNAGVTVAEATVTPEVKSAFNVLDSYAMGESPTDAEWNSALQTIAKAGLDPDAYLEDRTVRQLPATAANASPNVAISTSGGVPVGGTITAPVGDRAGQRSGQQDVGTERNIAGAAPVGTSRIGPLNDEQVQSTSVDGQTAENLGVDGQVEQINVEEPINVESLVGQVVDYGGNVGILAKTQSGYYVNGQVVESGMSGQPAQMLGIKQLPQERAEAFIAGESLGSIAPELQQVPRETDLDFERDVLLLEFEELIGVDETYKIIDIALSQLGGGANFEQQLNAVKGALYGYLEQATTPTKGVEQVGGTAAQSRPGEVAGAARAGEGTSSTTQEVGAGNAVQVQSPSESLLRSQRPEVGLQENGEGNQVNEVAAGTGQKEEEVNIGEEDIVLAELEEQLAELDRQASEIRSSKTLNLFSRLKGTLSASERIDTSPDKIYRMLQAKQGGVDISTLVSDGALDDFLPFDMRPESSRFDAYDSAEYIKEKIRARNFLPYDVEVQLGMLDAARQEIESQVNEIKSIQEANFALQQLADEEGIARSEGGIDSPAGVQAGALTSPSEDEVIAQQERVAQAAELDQREQIRKEADAAPFSLTVQEGRVDNTGTLFSETSEPIQNPTTPNAIKQAVNALFGGDVWAKISRGTEIISEAEAVKKLEELKGKYTLASLLAYHGSPYRFDKFSMDKILTGEGANSYGEGLYFADRKEIADWYRNKLVKDKMFTVKIDGELVDIRDTIGAQNIALASILPNSKGIKKSIDNAIKDYREKSSEYPQFAKSWIDAANYLEQNKDRIEVLDKPINGVGQLYEVKIPSDSEMLLWDKPLSEQPEKVRKALEPLLQRYEASQRKVMSAFKPSEVDREIAASRRTITGQGLYEQAGYMDGGDKKASEYLRSLGVRGIKYLDGASRAAGDGSYNYVIFDDSDVEITQTFYSELEGKAQAFYNPDDRKIYMISDRIESGTETAVWLHEVFHKQGGNLLDKAQMKRLQSTVESWKSKPEGSTERQIYDAASKRATKSGNYDAEFISYAIEEAVNLGVTPDSSKPATSAEGWLAKVQAWFSKALSKLTGKPSSIDFTPQDLVAMAYGAAGMELNQIEGAGPDAFGGIEQPRTPIGSTETVTVDGKEYGVLNSNGQPIHPTVEGVRNFWRWFKNSMVVDAQGRPLVVYHGTATTLIGDAFSSDLARSEGAAFYFSHSSLMKNPATNANDYAKGRSGDSPQVMPVFLQMKNPLVAGFSDPMPEGDEAIGKWLDKMQKFNRGLDRNKEQYYRSVIREAKAKGHDGVIIKNVEDVANDAGRRYTDETDVYIALEPEQIKSATGNLGTFDAKKREILFSINPIESRQNVEGPIREREQKTKRPAATRIGEWAGTQLTDYKIKGRNLIYEAGQKYEELTEVGERLQNAMTTARNQGNSVVELMTRDIVDPLEQNIKDIAPIHGLKPDNARIYAGELAAARDALDRSRKKENAILDDLLTAEINEDIAKDLVGIAKSEKENIANVVERIRGMEKRLAKAMDEGREFSLSKTTVNSQVTELASIVDRMVNTISPLQKDGVDKTLTAGKIKKVNDTMLRLAADTVRIGDPYTMLDVARKYTEAIESMANLPKAKELHNAAKEKLAAWKKAQATPLRLDKDKQDIATDIPLPGGQTMAESQAIIDMRSVPGVIEIADWYVKAFRDINTEAVRSKIITAEKKAELEALFPYYVSMSGDKNATADDDFMFSRGRNFIDKAEGRTGFLGQQNAFDNLVAKVQQLGNKVAAQSLARPAYDYMMQESQVVPENERLFEKVKMPGQNVMKVYSLGSTQYFQGKNQVMRDAMGDLVDPDNALIKAGQAVTRGYGSWMTKYVPLFAPVSAFKELGTKLFNLVQLRKYKKADGANYGIGDVYKIRGSMIANAASPSNFYDAFKYALNGETSPDMEMLMRDGGKMSFSDMLTTEGEVSNAFKKKYPKAWKVAGFPSKVFHAWNQMFETAIILAGYKSLKANGMSSKDAAAFTVSQMNFGAKGKATNFLRAFYPFVNPTMQDALQVKRSLYNNGKVNYQGIVELTVLIGLMAILYEMARESEEDEFGKPKVDAMPMSMVANGFQMKNGLYIPTPFGIPQLANVMAIAMSRLDSGVYTKGEAAAEIATAWARAFTPQGVSEIEASKDMFGFLISSVAPAIAKPAYHASKGINAFGTKVTAAERSDIYKSEQGMRMTPEAYKEFAKEVRNKLGVDENPEAYKIAAEGYLLGPLRGVLDVMVDPIADRESKGGDTGGMRTAINYALGINRLYKEFPASQIIETRFGDAYGEYQKLAKQFNVEAKKTRQTETRNQKLNRFYEAGATDAQIDFIDAVLEYESDLRKENAEMKSIYENGILSNDPTLQELGRETLKDMYAQKLERKREIAQLYLQLKGDK